MLTHNFTLADDFLCRYFHILFGYQKSTATNFSSALLHARKAPFTARYRSLYRRTIDIHYFGIFDEDTDFAREDDA